MKDTIELMVLILLRIGWVEVTSENGAGGYLWYLKSEHEAKIKI